MAVLLDLSMLLPAPLRLVLDLIPPMLDLAIEVDVDGSGIGGETSKLVNAVAGGSIVIVIIAHKRNNFLVHVDDVIEVDVNVVVEDKTEADGASRPAFNCC